MGSQTRCNPQQGVVRVGFFAVGISGPGSGAWSRLEALSTALSLRNDADVVVQLSDRSYARSLTERGVAVDLLDPVNRVRRFVGSERLQENFATRAQLDLLHIEVPPVGRNLSIPVVYSLHDLRSFHTPLWSIRSFTELYERLHVGADLNRADMTVTLSESTRRDIERFGSKHADVRILPPPVDPPPSLKMPWPSSVGGDQRYVLALGHLERRKNLDVLIRAAKSDRWPTGVRLVLAGFDLGSKAGLMDLATQLGVDVVFTGRVSSKEKWALLHHALAVTLPSTVEGFGIAAVEGALSGTPVLVSDATSLPEIFKMPEVVLDAHDHDAWATAIADMVGDPHASANIADRQRLACSSYSLDSIAATLMAHYRDLLAKGQINE